MHVVFKSKLIVCGGLTSLWMLLSPVAFSHGNHGNEFSEQEKTSSSKVTINSETARRLGVKVAPVQKQSLNVEIVATGQIELLPSQKVEVTAPIKGKIVQLLVQPGAQVRAGQPVATMTSPELGDLRAAAQEKKSEAAATLQQANADLQLASASYTKIQQIVKSEQEQALSQLATAQSRLAREQQLVQNGSVVQVARTSYQRQQQVAKAEITAAEIEVKVAIDRYQKDVELAAGGALPRRQVLESQAKLAEARTALAKAQSQPGVLQAEAELRRAETDLPLRELRDAEKQVTEAKGQLTKSLYQKSLVEAETQLRKAQAAVTAAQNLQTLSVAAYNNRIAQLGNSDSPNGIITIKSAIAGTVADQEITTGQSVADAGIKLMTIVNDRQVLATANIYERDLGKMKLGQEARVKVGSETFTGTVSRIGTAIDSQSRVVPVQVAINNQSGSLKAGMFAELRLATTANTAPLLVIPSTAIIEADGKQIVYIQNGSAYQPITITTGQRVGDLVEVKSGLFAGDQIVTQRAPQLYAQSLKAPAEEHPAIENRSVAGGSIAGFKIPFNLLWLLLPGALAIGGGALWFTTKKQRADRDFSEISLLENEDSPEKSLLAAETQPPKIAAVPENPSISPSNHNATDPLDDSMTTIPANS
jgi:membrane fusion protein, heavy metal efflux system